MASKEEAIAHLPYRATELAKLLGTPNPDRDEVLELTGMLVESLDAKYGCDHITKAIADRRKLVTALASPYPTGRK